MVPREKTKKYGNMNDEYFDLNAHQFYAEARENVIKLGSLRSFSIEIRGWEVRQCPSSQQRIENSNQAFTRYNQMLNKT